MILSIIVAVAQNGVIGQGNKLPWHIPEDLKRFKQLTTGHAVIMGRKTYESIGKPLPNRKNIVITRQPGYDAPGTFVVSSLQEAIQLSSQWDDEEAFVIGGAEIYRQTIPLADRIYLTIVRQDVAGDTLFPPIPEGMYTETAQEEMEAAIPLTFVVLERARPPVTSIS